MNESILCPICNHEMKTFVIKKHFYYECFRKISEHKFNQKIDKKFHFHYQKRITLNQNGVRETVNMFPYTYSVFSSNGKKSFNFQEMKVNYGYNKPFVVGVIDLPAKEYIIDEQIFSRLKTILSMK